MFQACFMTSKTLQFCWNDCIVSELKSTALGEFTSFWRRENAHRPRTHGNVFLRFCIVDCSQGNREQPANYLKMQGNVSVCTGPESRCLLNEDGVENTPLRILLGLQMILSLIVLHEELFCFEDWCRRDWRVVDFFKGSLLSTWGNGYPTLPRSRLHALFFLSLFIEEVIHCSCISISLSGY